MRKLLLISTALVGFAFASPASAAPVGMWVAGALGFTAGTASFAVVAGVVSMAASIGLSMIAQRLIGQRIGQDAMRQELTRPTSLPAYRFVYGKTWAPGTPVGWTVKGRDLYICYLLNSRPSAGPFTVYLDKRQVNLTGDPFDFDGPGANGTNWPFNSGDGGPHVWIWIGDGTQTKCPNYIVTNSGGYFSTTDRWRGRTVLWARFRLGSDDDRAERWPASPPELNVDGNWSLIEDPRDGQTKFTRNQGLIVLDALRSNPLRAYDDSYLRLDTFAWAANVAGQQVAVKGGGTIPRYRADGILVFSEGSELEGQLPPLLDAGASRFTRIGGKLAIIPAIARPAVKLISDVTDGQPVDLVRWRSSDDLYTEAVVRFTAPDRAYESAEAPAYIVAGARAEDGGVAKRLTYDLEFVTDHRQAQRLAKIMAMRSRMQRQISAELFPDCFDLVAGSVARVELPAPYTAWNRKYEVESIIPTAGLADEDSITIRLPVTLTETADEIYAWDAETEEKDMIAGSFTGNRGRVLPPPKPVMTTGTAAAHPSGDETVPGVVGAWTASASASASRYQWEWKLLPVSGPVMLSSWRAGGVIDQSAADADGVYVASIPWIEVGRRYQIRVQTIGSQGRSEWVVSDEITAQGPAVTIAAPPAPNAVAPGPVRINLTAQQSNDRNARALLIYSGAVDNPLAASQLGAPINAGASVTVQASETGLTSGTTRYYWTRSRDQWGNLSEFSPSASATTT